MKEEKQGRDECHQYSSQNKIGKTPSDVRDYEFCKQTVDKAETATHLAEPNHKSSPFNEPVRQCGSQNRPAATGRSYRHENAEEEVEMGQLLSEPTEGSGETQKEDPNEHHPPWLPTATQASGKRSQETVDENVQRKHECGTPSPPAKLVQYERKEDREGVSHSINESHADEADGDDHPTVENIEAHKRDPDFQPNLRIEGGIPGFKILYDPFLIKVLGVTHDARLLRTALLPKEVGRVVIP